MKADVLTILPDDGFLHRNILEGVLAYGREHGPWRFSVEITPSPEQIIRKCRQRKFTGLIAMVREADLLRELLAMKTPAVFLNPSGVTDLKPARPPAWATFLDRDQENVGATAAEYFLSRRYRNFAFVGTSSPETRSLSTRRLNGFRERLGRDGFDCASFQGGQSRNTTYGHLSELAGWLKSLNHQTALYAACDRLALQVIDLCNDLRISVPESVAVLGTDNDEVLCDSITPPLSSISLDGRNAGMLSAQLLDAHMRKRKVEPLVDLAFPRVITRRSTDDMRIPDRFLAKALAIVNKDLSVRHTIADLASAVGVSKRTLEMKATLFLGTTLKAEIDRIRINEAVRLISNSALTMQSVAEKCGFCGAGHLNTRFKAVFGHNPSVFRYRDPE